VGAWSVTAALLCPQHATGRPDIHYGRLKSRQRTVRRFFSTPFDRRPFFRPARPPLWAQIAGDGAKRANHRTALVFRFHKVGREHVRRRIYRRLSKAVVTQLNTLGFSARLAAQKCTAKRCAIQAARAAGVAEAWTGTVSVTSKVYASGRVHHLTLNRWDVRTGKLKATFDKYAEVHYGNLRQARCRHWKRARHIGCGNHHLLYIAAWLTRFVVKPPKRPQPIPFKPVGAHPKIPNMAYVPAGDFVMGGYFGEFDEAPPHLVYLDAYYMDRTETSNAEYKECVRYGPCKPSALRTKVYLMHPKQPVCGVSWFDARTYCRWRGKRLATEAEMEKAARATDGRRFAWGNTFDRKKLNLRGREDGYRWTAPVDSLPAGKSAYGIYHLSGNVWEWCHDNIDKQYYKKSPRKNPQGPPFRRRMRKCMRAGTWMYNVPFYASTTNRSPLWSWKRYKYTGIRCALSGRDRSTHLTHAKRLARRLAKKKRRQRHRRKRGRTRRRKRTR
jgi:formylglycine-generating enzyme required for sulfatase activity